MGNRNKLPRLTHPLLVAAAAVSRATDPANPSRLTVLRLLGDALHALQESHITLTAIKARSNAQLSKNPTPPLNRNQIELDNRFRHAHNEGARALFSVTVTALIRLPVRGGPLRRRAIDLLKLAALATGPASAMAAVDRLRSHISALKRLSWSDADPADFEVSAAVLTLADISTCHIASRDVARESILFLLNQRVRQKCRRSDIAHALATILASFPQHAPPDDRLVDLVLEFCLSSSNLKQGLSGFGGALLVAVVVPFMVNRGPTAGDEIASTCARALKGAPTPTERSMWAIALARAVVTARRSTTYQLRKYGTVEKGSRFPKVQANASRDENSDSETTVWISSEIFEEALVQVAKLTDFSEGTIDSSVALASVLKMWLSAVPTCLDTIIPRALLRLVSGLMPVAASSAVVDAICLGVLKHLRPSQSATVFESVIPLLSDSEILFPATLSVCATLLRKFGRQALKESGLSTDFNTNSSVLIKRVHDALESPVCVTRLGGTRVLSAMLHTLPRTCTPFLTGVLQSLRIADMSLATKPFDSTTVGLSHFEQELAPLLGNGAALSVLVEKVGTAAFSVPAPLSRQCLVDMFALLQPNEACEDIKLQSVVIACIRRRVAWGITAALARGKRKEIFEGETMSSLLYYWTEELKFTGGRASKATNNPLAFQGSGSSLDHTDLSQSAALDEALAKSSARAAALCAISHALRNLSSIQLEDCARALVGACAARIIALLSNVNSSLASSSASSNAPFLGFGMDYVLTTDVMSGKKRGILKLLRSLVSESSQLVQVVSQVPPSGDAGELCFFVSMALAEEAQRTLGEFDTGNTMNGHLAAGASGSDRSTLFEGVMSNNQCSMESFECFDSRSRQYERAHIWKKEKNLSPDHFDVRHGYNADMTWLFGKEGIKCPVAERALTDAARAIAAVVSADLVAHGSLIESLPEAKLSPSLCAAISLELTKRLSRSDLAEVNRALAVLQVLVRRSLGLTGGAQRSIASQNKSGRLYTPSNLGDGLNFRAEDLPGSALQEISQFGEGLSWARTFSDESHLRRLPFHNFHTRALGLMYTTRSLSSEAYRELSITGGPTLWIGLLRKVVGIVRDNIGGSSASQYILVSNAVATLGALLEVIPEPASGIDKQSPRTVQKNRAMQSAALKEISEEAINVIADAIESGKSHIQATSALALSSRSYLVASCSERLIGALLRAWANDKGEFGSLGHFGRCSDEADAWVSCFSRIWSDMGIRDAEETARFYEHDSSGIGSMAPSFATGASGVLGACRLYWWPLSESSFCSVKEISTELVQWHGNCSHQARTAGLYGMVSIWSGKIDSAQAKRMSALVAVHNDGPSGGDEEVLPVDSFSLIDTSRVSSHVGPFLDEVVYNALAPGEDGIPSRELRVAATSAITEMIRGVGVDKTCANLPRLPEMLFAAIEAGTPGAQSIMDALVNRDAEVRPRYWFGLCRAVTLGGDRLNFGKKGTTWDLSFRTKAYSVRVAVDAIDCSTVACACRTTVANVSRTSNLRHTCAYGFLRKIFDFAKQVSSAASFDFESCGHGCRLLQRIASRVGSAGLLLASSDSTISDFFEMWDPSVAMMHTLLTDRVPHGVVNSAATAVSELLVSSLRLRKVDNSGASQRCAETVSSYMKALMECDLRQRLLYSDQGEEVGMHALLALIGKYGRIMSSLKASRVKNGHTNERLAGEGTAKRLFFALCGDFASILDEEGLRAMALNGGALTSGQVEEDELRKAMSSHISSIILGAVSCVSGENEDAGDETGVSWENEESPGVLMALNHNSFEEVALGSLVWLIKHEHSVRLSKFRRLSFCNQGQEALEYLFLLKVNPEMCELRGEILTSFAEWNKTEALKFAERMSVHEDVGEDNIGIMMNVTLSVFLIALQDEFSTFRENETRSLCRGLRAICNMVSGAERLRVDSIAGYAKKTLDVLFQLTCHDSLVVASILSESKVQTALCETLRICVEALRNQTDVMDACERKIWSTFEQGRKVGSVAVLRVSLALSATLSDLDVENVDNLLFNMIVSDRSSPGRRNGMPSALMVALDCHGVEDCIVNYINMMSISCPNDVVQLLLAFGDVAATGTAYAVPVALRCSVAAIIVDGEFCESINKMGMVLYSIFLSRLVQSLPTEESIEANDVSVSSLESAYYFLELVEEEMEQAGGIISSLRDIERETAQNFLSVWCANIRSPLPM